MSVGLDRLAVPIGTASLRPPDPIDLARAFEVVGDRWEQLRDAHVFMTGGTGFVGKWMIATLLEANRRLGLDCAITVLTRDPVSFRRHAALLATASRVRLLEGNVCSFKADIGACSHVVHAATDAVTDGSPLVTFDTCVAGTRRVLDAARSVGAAKVLLVSSGAVYGKQPADLTTLPETHSGGPEVLRPASAYAEGKRAAEWLGAAYCAIHQLQVKIARLFAFIGPYLPMNRHFAAGNFIGDALAGRTITLQGDGTALRTYLHSSDMAGWLWSILIDGRAGDAYNVGGSEVVSMRDLALQVAGAAGSTSGIDIRGAVSAGAKPDRYVPDVSKALRELQLPEPWTVPRAVERTVAWHRVSQ